MLTSSRSAMLHGSTERLSLVCAEIQYVLGVIKYLDVEENQERKIELDRMAAILSQLGGREHCVRGCSELHECTEFDPDSDLDTDEIKYQKISSGDG